MCGECFHGSGGDELLLRRLEIQEKVKAKRTWACCRNPVFRYVHRLPRKLLSRPSPVCGLSMKSTIKENAPELDYSLVYVTTGTATHCLVAQDLALLTKVRTLILAS
jgi:hypothetical protein